MNQRTILLCDDNREVGLIFKIILKSENVRVDAVTNGKEALEYLKAWPNTGLILLDLKMPQMGGTEFLKIRREDPSLSRIPVVLLSGNVNISDIATEFGIEDYIEKNCGNIELADVIKNLIAKYIENSESGVEKSA